MVSERPLCVALDGFTLHAATRAGGLDEQGREALLKYILRRAVAQERVTRGPDGLVRLALKKAFSDGTVAVDLDPLSLLSRLCASVPPPRFSPVGDHEARHTVRYAGAVFELYGDGDGADVVLDDVHLLRHLHEAVTCAATRRRDLAVFRGGRLPAPERQVRLGRIGRIGRQR
jgi:hypothetical protein